MTRGVVGDPVAQTEYVLARIVVLFRGAGLLELLIVTGLDRSNYRSGAVPLAAVLLAVVAEGVALCALCLRERRILVRWAAADLLFVVGAVVVCAPLAAPRLPTVYMMYPFSIITSVAFGVCFRRLSSVLAATAVLVVGYVAVSLVGLHLPTGRVVVDVITYVPNTVVAWAVARQLRHNGAELKRSRQRETALVREQERASHVRLLHDRALQTLETLAAGHWIADPDFRAHIAAEAAWLRGFVQDGVASQECDLLAALHRLVADKARDGLRVEFNGSALKPSLPWRDVLGPIRTSALVDATREVLTNVSKHAGVNTTIMRVSHRSDGGLSLSVLDHGSGFDPAVVHRGIGLAQSVCGRIAEVGGQVRIDSLPGAGTYVEMLMPARGVFAGQRV